MRRVERVGNGAVDGGVRTFRPVPVAVQMQTVPVETQPVDRRRQHVEDLEPLLEVREPGVVPQDLGTDE